MSDRKNCRSKKAEAFFAKWRAEIERLERELARAHEESGVVDATVITVALTIRREAVRELGEILGSSDTVEAGR